jgi:hypothetical protein
MKTKRFRKPKVKPGQLIVYWGRVDGDSPDICYNWGGGGASKCDGSLLNMMFSGYGHVVKDDPPKLSEMIYGHVHESHFSGYLRELELRGYDLSTLKFTIQQKEKPV